MHNMTTWQTRLAKGKTTGKGGGKDIVVTLTSRGWDSQACDKGARLMVIVSGNPIAELQVEPSLSVTMEVETTGIVIKEEDDASLN